MPPSIEKLEGNGAVKATMLAAHLAWAEQHVTGAKTALRDRVGAEAARFLEGALLATLWVPLRELVEIDRAIAGVVDMPEAEVYRAMGRHSAELNLGGVYRIFVKREPHRFFQRMMLLHDRFQSFGRPLYQETGEHSGRLQLEGCEEFSPVYCASARGYYEGVLEMMKVPGPIVVVERTCQCAGEAACLYELSW